MTRSMTGFGRARSTVGGSSMTCEVRSVNHRNLDVRARLPKALSMHQDLVVNQVRERLSRGHVEVNLHFDEDKSSGAQQHDAAALAALMTAFRQMAKTHEEIEPTVRAGELLAFEPLWREPTGLNKESVADDVTEVVLQALDALLVGREAEGKALEDAIRTLLEEITAVAAHIATMTANQPSAIREKMNERLAQAKLDIPDDRVAQEIALIAERASVREELDRIGAHVAHFYSLVDGGGPSGRKLNFLSQELLREANTIASKSIDAETTHRVVDLKALIEDLREQVQNIE